ncbi:hypothetical protein GE21DRAFT_1221411, partial [Neurospora crassa]
LLLQIDSRGSTRKSFFIKALLFKFEQIVAIYNKTLLIIRYTPTGVIANSINGQTLHSLFKLPITPKNIN